MDSIIHPPSSHRDSDGILVEDVDALPDEHRDLPSAHATSVRDASAPNDLLGRLMSRHELQALKRPRSDWGRARHPHSGACAPLPVRPCLTRALGRQESFSLGLRKYMAAEFAMNDAFDAHHASVAPLNAGRPAAERQTTFNMEEANMEDIVDQQFLVPADAVPAAAAAEMGNEEGEERQEAGGGQARRKQGQPQEPEAEKEIWRAGEVDEATTEEAKAAEAQAETAQSDSADGPLLGGAAARLDVAGTP